MKKKLFISLNIILPIIIGSIIYILFRPTSLIIFNFFSFINVDIFIMSLRNTNFHLIKYIPNFFIYSFPNALWVYSFSFFTLMLWYNYNILARILSFIFIFIIAIGIELCQLNHYLPGTYDCVDLITSIFSSLMALIIITYRRKTNEIN